MRKSIALAAAAATVSLFVSTSAQATTGTWISSTATIADWSDTTKWQGGIVPNAQGDVAQKEANSTVSGSVRNNIVGGVTVGTLRLFGNSNHSMQFTPTNNIILDQDGAGPGHATIINDAFGTVVSGTPPSATSNISIFLNSATTGKFILQDDLYLINHSNSTRDDGSIRIRGPFNGNGNIYMENDLNDINAGAIKWENSQSGTSGGFGGNIFINKGAVSHTRGDVFTPGPKVVTIGAAGMGDASLGFIAADCQNMEYNFVAAANTGGTSRYVANATSPTGIVQIKSSGSATGQNVNLLGDMTFENAQTNGSKLIIGNPVIGAGKLTKAGPGPLEITNTNSYSGGTVVNNGSLLVRHAPAFNNGFGDYVATDGTLGYGDVTVNNTATFLQIDTLLAGINVIADAATVSLAGGGNGGAADLGYMQLDTGINETVGALALGGAFQLPGTYGSTASGATFTNDEYFSGPGILTVLRNPDFNGDLFNVNAADYVSWRKNDGTDAGYQSFRHNFNFPISPAGLSLEGASVPEPGTLLLTVTGLVLACTSQRRR